MVLTVFAAQAPATEYFIAPNGQDEQEGTSLQTAMKTIQSAIKRLHPGDVLTIAPGEYQQRFTIPQKATIDRPMTIRAAIPGFSIIRGSVPIRPFQLVAGKRFVWATPSERPVYRIIEMDTGEAYLPAPAIIDMDQFRPSFLYNQNTRTLYIHTSDGRPPDQHQCAASVLPGPGVEVLGEYIHIEGLVIQGFYTDNPFDFHRSYGMSIKGRFNEVRQCSFFHNGGGAMVDAKSSVVRDSLFVGNYAPHMPQLYVTGHSENIQVLHNTVLDAPTHGIRAYETPRDVTISNNIVRNAVIGLDFKASEGTRIAHGNIVTGCTYLNWNSGSNTDGLTENANTFAEPAFWEKKHAFASGPNTLIFSTNREDPKFADPDHLDYRLQADSPYRGRGPAGTDLGALPYNPDLLFVGPDGNDANDGLCAARAFATIGRALSIARPGITIYILPGDYNETLRLTVSGSEDKPIFIRGHGKNTMPRVSGIDLVECSHIQIENLHVTGPARIQRADNIRLEQCFLTNIAEEGISVIDTTRIWLRRLTAWNIGGPAVSVKGRCPGLRITSSVLNCQSGPPLRIEGPTDRDMFREYNNYVVIANQPLAIIGDQTIMDMTSLAGRAQGDRYSISANPQFNDITRSPEIAATSPCAGNGELFGNIGAGTVSRQPLPPQVADIQLRDVTPHSASLTWWTPNVSSKTRESPREMWDPYPIHAEVHYGTTPAMDKKVHSFGDLYHRVTLRDLQPDTTYHFKVVILDRPWADSVGKSYAPLDGQYHWPGGESTVLAFKTPAINTWQSKRRIFHVSPIGNDADSGLDENAPTTLTAASDRVRAGDTVILSDGIYEEMFAPASSGVPDAPITLKARHPGQACLDGTVFIRPAAVALFWKDRIVIDGVVMRRFADRNHGRRAGLFDCQVLSMQCGDITIRNCVLSGWQFGCTDSALVARGGKILNINNCVITGFMSAINVRDVDQTNLIGNTWYVPLITNFNVPEHCILKNNLFFGQEKQKVFQNAPMVSKMRPAESDYNAYYFGPDNPVRHIGYGIEPKGEKDIGGLARIQRELKMDLHSIEPTTQDVELRGLVPTDYLDSAALAAFARKIATGQLIPTLDMFALPPTSRLNTAGEHGSPIGARPADTRRNIPDK